MIRFAVFLAICALIISGCSTEQVDKGERATVQPKAQPTDGKDHGAKNNSMRHNGVVITRDCVGDRCMTAGVDLSGYGAVLCSWGIYIALEVYLDSCFPGQDAELRGELAHGIDEINDFIIENSLKPLTIENLEERISKEKEKFQSLFNQDIETVCRTGPKDQEIGFLAAMRSHMTAEKLRAAIADLLSIPRPPVRNPCF